MLAREDHEPLFWTPACTAFSIRVAELEPDSNDLKAG